MHRALAVLSLLVFGACAGPPVGRTDGSVAPDVFVARDTVVARIDGVAVLDGGLSALTLGPGGALWAVADRGPNLDAEASEGRPAKRFAVPDYAPALTRLEPVDGVLRVAERRPLRRPDGGRVSGRPVPATGGAEVETALGPDGARLAPDPWGVDAEGLAFDGPDLWLAEEYRPSLWRVDAASGVVLERWTPTPTEPGDRPLPAVVAGRQANLGFEGVAVVGGVVVASLQGPIQTPGSDPATPFARILRLDPRDGSAETFAYPLAGPLRKIGDLEALADGRLLVLEHGPDDTGTWSGQIYAVDLRDAAPLGDAFPERFATEAEARAAGVPVVRKTLVLDLVEAGWPRTLLKPEGLAVLPDGRLAVLADNDYGVDAPAADGRAVATGVRTTLVVFDAPRLLRDTYSVTRQE